MRVHRFKPRSLFADKHGGVALLFSLAAPAMAALACGAIELADIMRVKTALQATVDSAALDAAHQLSVQPIGAADRARFQADSSANRTQPRWTITTSADADVSQGSVTIRQDASRASSFGFLLGSQKVTVHVTATAKALGRRVPLCVLGLQQGANNVLTGRDGAVLTASDCLVQSDGDLQVSDAAKIRAGLVRTVGAATGSITPPPITDSPVVSDPFLSLPIQVPSTCTDTNFYVSGTTRLSPGVHCGKINVKGNDQLILNAGEHYFFNAEINVVGKGQIVGTDVVLVFSGKFDFVMKGQASFSIEGRRSGPYAGFAIVTDRDFTNTVELSTDSARQILGTVYLPAAKLLVSGTGNKIADQSAWTVIVSNSIQVKGTAELVVNSNYASSTVPLPSAIDLSRTILSQ